VKAIFDTNVLIAAFVAEGLCASLLRRARRGDFLLCLSPFIISEFENVLLKKIKADKLEIRDAIKILKETVHEIVDTDEEVKGVCRDKDDDNILSCAKVSRADYLVTGDDDLLILKKFDKTRIITPRDFEIMLLSI
jgi:uncharacterized protein